VSSAVALCQACMAPSDGCVPPLPVHRDLSRNDLTGTLPAEWSAMTSMTHL
jgi:hypothetical protein